MRKIFLLFCFALVCKLATAQESSLTKSYSVESAAQFIKMAKEMPVTKLGLYGQDAIDMYNTDYFSTPELLRQMDETVTAYAAGETTEAEYKKIRGLGKEAVLGTVADLSGFLQKYNEAARKAGGKNHVFSPEFIRFAEKRLAEAEKK